MDEPKERPLGKVTNIKTTDSKGTADRCHVCAEMVTFGTRDGHLVAFQGTSLDLHRHQPEGNTAAANRERIARERAQ